MRIDEGLERGRLGVLARLILAVPHIVWLYVWTVAAAIFLVGGWFVAVVKGRLPDGVHDFLVAYLRYSTWVWAYVLLVTDRFPPFTGRAGAYPIDLEIDPPVRQSRWSIAFRLGLAIPVLWLESAIEGVVYTIAFLAWFVCLASGRMPPAMRSFAVFAAGYRAQAAGYAVLLTGRYPGLDFPRPG